MKSGFILKCFFIVFLIVSVTFLSQSVAPVSSKAYIQVSFDNSKIYLNGVLFSPRDINGNIVKPIICNGTIYLPINAVADLLNIDAACDYKSPSIYLTKRGGNSPEPDETSLLQPESPSVESIPESSKNMKVILNEVTLYVDGKQFISNDMSGSTVSTFIFQGTVYMPVITAAAAFGKNVLWDPGTSSIFLGKRPVSEIFITPPASDMYDGLKIFKPTDIFCSFPPNSLSIDKVILRSHVSFFCPINLFFYLPKWGPITEEEAHKLNTSNVKLAADKGIGLIHWLSVANLDEARLEGAPEPNDTACIDLYGKPVQFSLEAAPLLCTNNPIWRKYLLRRAVKAIEDGCVSIAADEPLGSLQAMPKGCFCKYCMSGFNQFLKGKYTEKELKEIGIEDIETFDFSEYVKNTALQDFKNMNFQNDRLIAEYRLFQLSSALNLHKEIREAVVEAGRKLGRQVCYSANMADLGTDYMALTDVVDIITSEVTYDMPPSKAAISLYKIGDSLNKPLYASPNCFLDKDMMVDSGMTEIMKIYTAEAYSNKAHITLPYNFTVFLQDSGRINTYVYAKMEELYPYYDFINGNKQLFDGLVHVEDIGVIYSYASSKYYSSGFDANFRTITKYFLDNGYNYDVIFTGDNDMVKESLDLKKLEQYRVIVMPNISNLSSQDEQTLIDYMSAGGTIISFGQTAVRNQNDVLSNSRLNLHNGFTEFGEGKLVHFQNDVFVYDNKAMNTMLVRNDAQKVLAVVSGEVPKKIEWDHPESIAMTRYYSAKLNGYVVHAVNYSYNADSHSIIPAQDISMKIVDDTPFKEEQLGVFFVSPESKNIKPIEFTLNDGYIQVKLPSFEAWGTVIIGDKQKIMECFS